MTLRAGGAGVSSVTLTARDPAGAAASASFVVRVASRPPEVVSRPADRHAYSGLTFSFDLRPHFRDPDGDRLSFSAVSSDPAAARPSVAGSSLEVLALRPGTPRIELTAADPSGASAWTLFYVEVTVEPFTDPVITARETAVRAVHFAELRIRVEALVRRAGLRRRPWTDPVLSPGTTLVRAAHVSELRGAVDDLRRARGLPVQAWTDPAVVPGRTPVRAVHMRELRDAVIALETGG